MTNLKIERTITIYIFYSCQKHFNAIILIWCLAEVTDVLLLPGGIFTHCIYKNNLSYIILYVICREFVKRCHNWYYSPLHRKFTRCGGAVFIKCLYTQNASGELSLQCSVCYFGFIVSWNFTRISDNNSSQKRWQLVLHCHLRPPSCRSFLALVICAV